MNEREAEWVAILEKVKRMEDGRAQPDDRGGIMLGDYIARQVLENYIKQPSEGAMLRERRAVALRQIEQLALFRAQADVLIARAVGVARKSGGSYYDYGQPTWEQIGKALGITKQSAQARFKDVLGVCRDHEEIGNDRYRECKRCGLVTVNIDGLWNPDVNALAEASK